MDKGLTAPKWVLILRPKIPQMPQNLFAQFVCPNPKVLDFIEKRLHWASVIHVVNYSFYATFVTYVIMTVILKTNKMKLLLLSTKGLYHIRRIPIDSTYFHTILSTNLHIRNRI